MFYEELYKLRENILKEREDITNKQNVNDFMIYLRDFIYKDKENIENAFRFYVKNNPCRNTYNIERTYHIPSTYTNGMNIFFGLLGNTYITPFINDIISNEYVNFSINLKNISEKDELKIYINYYIDLNKIKNIT
jgi:hypothetical protein